MCFKRLASCNFESQRIYDFYKHPNIPQARQVREVLLSYNRSLDKALKNWPEHDVLQNLSSICQKIISFPITSPIIKLLVGLEILLVKSDDWERYASKEFSLRSELNQLIGLIIQWRKLELESWRDLLNIEASKATEKVSGQWFHLWKIITSPILGVRFSG
jgi:midasin